ncbi:hypothetical protein ACWD3I_48955 [Streptomyces sp. NPDC002817]|uniref:coiled-coil domain-containing protein n=1 Tax=Streptomyces sp. NPDC088357 TaxID=3154655 RepID=UPI0034187CCA
MNSAMERPSDPPEGEKYGEAVKRLLSTAGLKQDQLAASVPMSSGQVSKILNDANTSHTASHRFHDAVVALLGLDKEGDQARYLETLHQAAANLNSLHYWRDETERWRQEAERLTNQVTYQVEEACKDRSVAQEALATLQGQLDRLAEDMNQALNRAQEAEEERDELRLQNQQQKIQLTQAAKYAMAQGDDLRIAQEESRRLGQQVRGLQQQVRVLQHQVRLLQEEQEQASSQAVSMVETAVASGTTTEEAKPGHAPHDPPSANQPSPTYHPQSAPSLSSSGPRIRREEPIGRTQQQRSASTPAPAKKSKPYPSCFMLCLAPLAIPFSYLTTATYWSIVRVDHGPAVWVLILYGFFWFFGTIIVSGIWGAGMSDENDGCIAVLVNGSFGAMWLGTFMTFGWDFVFNLGKSIANSFGLL